MASKVNNITRVSAKMKLGLAAIFKYSVFVTQLLALGKHLKIIYLILLGIKLSENKKKVLNPKLCDLNWHVHCAK